MTKLTDNQARQINSESPMNQFRLLGTSLKNALNAGKPFKVTGVLTQAAATTAVVLISDSEVAYDEKVYITGFIAKVNGATAWSGTGTVVTVQDNAAAAQLTFAKAGLTGNAIISNLADTNTTIAAGISLQSGATIAKGISVVADGAFSAGSDLYITISGFIA